ncbi:MAG: flagellar hook-associated protein FlgK, partial [bacterium]
MSIFTGFETARRALMAQQQALNTTNHNIANANTPGFSRQQAVFATTPAYTLGHSLAGKALEMGTGVKIEDIRRMRDSFLDYQFRSEVKELGRWEVRRDTLQKMEVVINEPSEAGLASVLESFWDSWHELSENPESSTARAVVLQQGIALVDTLNHLSWQLYQLRQDLNETLEIYINEINSLARQIADLNDQIIRVEASSKRANDLRDKRDLLVDQLAKLTGVHVTEKESGAIDVVIGNRGLVEGTRALSLKTQGDREIADLV